MSDFSDNGGFGPLRLAVDNGSFWTIPEVDFVKMVKAEFPHDIDCLKGAYSTTATEAAQSLPHSPSPSVVIYGAKYDEVDRTIVGILALRWLRNDDYEQFTRSQPQSVRLKRKSFNWIRDIFVAAGVFAQQNNEDLYALVLSMVINDLGKDPNLGKRLSETIHRNVSDQNHDMVLYLAIEAGMVPVWERLDSERQRDMLLGMRVGAELNIGQLAQAENVPASLQAAKRFTGHQRAWTLRYLEQLLDIAGASGHLDHTCALKLIDPVFRSYRNAYDIITGVFDPLRNWPLRDAYDLNLTRRLELLVGEQAYYNRSNLSIKDPEQRAIMRLFCIGNVASAEVAELFEKTFHSALSFATRELLVNGLNVDGSVTEPAVLPAYIPAMVLMALNSQGDACRSSKVEALAAVMRYLARTLRIDDKLKEELRRDGVMVIERDVRKTAIDVVMSTEFKEAPSVLDASAIPDWSVAQSVHDGWDFLAN